jgi:uncharacterized protein YyaL (SSP411 family)
MSCRAGPPAGLDLLPGRISCRAGSPAGYAETVPNALAHETSPYLRQHAGNPVDWLPWGPGALMLARERDVPLLISIGYSSCHWCHVMEHESFEDPKTAALMNEEFVCVKVDREERPDIDALYMEAVQGMTGHGGWPLNVFLTPEQLPFYGGTYFPPEPRPGMPAWTQVLQAVAEAWHERKQEIRTGGERLRERLGGGALLSPSAEPIRAEALTQAVASLRESFDVGRGGFGGAPKFPQASVLEFLLARALADVEKTPPLADVEKTPPGTSPGENPTAASARGEGHGAESGDEARMALPTLRAMASGGIHDQVGGGFHRYAVDSTWTVPHFEKMLYDNALLARAYLHGYRLSDDPELERVCRDTLDWMLREMQGPEGGFYSALDADSEGVEGRYYVWTIPELEAALGQDADAAIRWLGATEEGNFEDPSAGTQRDALSPGLNVLEDRGPRPVSQTRERVRARLLTVREQRVRPGLDDKRLTSWNALAIAAFADAGAVLGEPRYLDTAVRCAQFVLRELREGDAAGEPMSSGPLSQDDGAPARTGSRRLLRTYSEGQARLPAYLEDYAFLLEALLTLFEATCDERWLSEARALADETIARFADARRGGFFSTAEDHEPLIARRKDLEDSPIPSGASSATLGLLRLARTTGELDYERQAVGTLRLLHEIAPRHPTSFGHLLQAMQLYLFPAQWLACAVPPAKRGNNPYSTAK